MLEKVGGVAEQAEAMEEAAVRVVVVVVHNHLTQLTAYRTCSGFR